MRKSIIVFLTAAWFIIGLSDVATANGFPACFFYGGKSNPDMVCIVTKIDGHRLCMVEYHVPSNTRYNTEMCEFIRDIGNVKIGDHIIINADEWELYNGPQNLDSMISYTWEQKRGGPSGKFKAETYTVV